MLKSILKFILLVFAAILIIVLFSHFHVVSNVTKKWNEVFQPGLKSQDEVEPINANDAVWNEMERASEKAEKPTLDDDFIDNYVDTDSQEDLKDLVEAGMTAVRKDLEVGTKEYELMKALINTNKISYITTDDLQKTYDEFNAALDKLAAEKNMSKADYLSQYYDMSSEEFQAFAQKKAQDLKEANQKAMEEKEQEP